MMIGVCRGMNKRVAALLTNMNQPLGRWVGNAVETREAIETLRGDLSGDFAELSLELAAWMLVVGGVTNELSEAREQARRAVTSGAALDKFRACVEAQGGDARVLDDTSRLPTARHQQVITAARAGYVSRVETDEVGRVVMDWGGGRRRLEDPIDYGVGLYLHAKLGDFVDAGAPLVTAHYNDESKVNGMTARLRAAFALADEPPPTKPLIEEVISELGSE
jgi:pyrimidine-nucleoside phosphorylase